MVSELLSVFYPLNCKSCSASLVRGEVHFCLKCELNFAPITKRLKDTEELDQLFWGKVKIEHSSAVFQFLKQEKLQSLIHLLKYKGDKKLARYLGGLMAKQEVFYGIDYISFVPMHKKKEKKRGYNQGKELAIGYSKECGIPVLDCLIRKEASTTQTEKGVFERFENMEGKFKLKSDLELKGIKHILLIDDVLTTGATLAACATELVKHDFKVSVFCLAYRGVRD